MSNQTRVGELNDEWKKIIEDKSGGRETLKAFSEKNISFMFHEPQNVIFFACLYGGRVIRENFLFADESNLEKLVLDVVFDAVKIIPSSKHIAKALEEDLLAELKAANFMNIYGSEE
ncbi:hypothetical protein Q0M94_28115 (plasmid) [Deinococcus radiomollis]|uniref:hypothetical protein n=1 Tax=Deinococcus radiomollis TaxID=468916 RepID=UPI003891DCC1